MATAKEIGSESPVHADFQKAREELAEKWKQLLVGAMQLPVNALAFVAKHFFVLLAGAGVVLFNGLLVIPASGSALTALAGPHLGQKLYRDFYLGGLTRSLFPRMTTAEMAAYALMIIAMVLWHFVARILFFSDMRLNVNARIFLIVVGSLFLIMDSSLIFFGIQQQANWGAEEYGLASAIFFTLLYLCSMLLFSLFSAWVSRKE